MVDEVVERCAGVALPPALDVEHNALEGFAGLALYGIGAFGS